MAETERIEGTVAQVTYQNRESGFTVLELETDTELVTVVGQMPSAASGRKLSVEGSYVNHPSFGIQFRADSYRVELPTDENAILTYLSSGSVKGVGPALAKRLVKTFGDETLRVIDGDLERLCSVRGISRRLAEDIQREFRRINGIQDVISGLSVYGINSARAVALYGAYGRNTVDTVRENPYILCAAPCFLPFERADNIASRLAFEYDSRRRVNGGIIHVLRHNSRNGHCCLPRDKLVPTTAGFIGVEPEKVRSALENMCDEAALLREEIDGRDFIYLPEIYAAEIITSRKIARILRSVRKNTEDTDGLIASVRSSLGIEYAENQIKALKTVAESNMCIITGGPGTGKTTLVRGIISMFESRADIVSLCAPTGRAAKRLAELSGRTAKTIHRLLEVVPGSKNAVRFARNKDNPLNCDVLIVDECSMVDIELFSCLISRVRDSCRVVLVGDYNQLPAVGPGNVLKDLLDCPFIPSVRLTEIFRQARKSDIILNAHAINRGNAPKFSKKTGDCFFIPSSDPAGLISDLIKRRLPAAYGFNPQEDIQIICPSRKRPGGTVNMNAVLQRALNPPSPEKKQFSYNGVVYRTGDKVMQIKNNYDLEYVTDSGITDCGVFNGDIGVVTRADSFNRTLTVKIDDKTYVYTREFLNQLEHAWAVTVHKSQGSEFRAVILCLSDVPAELRYRNLLYTAFTRARELLVTVGDSRTVAEMTANTKKKTRYSGLKHFLEGYFE